MDATTWTDRLLELMAEAKGIQLPEIEDLLSDPPLHNLIQRVEETFGVRVIPRSHTFLMEWAVGPYTDSDKVVTLFVHPKWSLAQTRQTLYHEAGHILQHRVGAEFDDSLDGFYGREIDAWERGFRLAEDWGDAGDLFPPAEREEIISDELDMKEAATVFSGIAGIGEIPILDAVLWSFLAGTDFMVESDILPLLGPSKQRTAKALAELLRDRPELFVAYSRRALYPFWTLSFEVVEGEAEPLFSPALEVKDPEGARRAWTTAMRRVSKKNRWVVR